MSILNNSLLLGAPAAATGYSISRSLRFNSADSSFLSRTPGSAGNRRTFTWAAWVKRNRLGVFARLFAAGAGTSDATFNSFGFTSGDLLSFDGTASTWRRTTAVYRDPGAWMHICLAVDTTLATAANRVRLYVNGSEVTAFSSSSDPTQNYDYAINNNVEHQIGADKYGNAYSYYSDFMLADAHLIDGQQLTPTSFGEFDATTGVWVPKAYTGSYGTNGFRLDFSDNSAATAAAIGADRSGNGNNFTPSNISVSAGAGNDSLVDVPTNGSQTDTGAGGEVRGNYCTLNPLFGGGTISNGNLQITNGASHVNAKTTIAMPSSGKFYIEATVISATNNNVGAGLGLCNSTLGNTSAAHIAASGVWMIYPTSNLNFNRNGTQTSTGSGVSAGAVLQLAIDADNSRAWVGINNVWYDGSNGTTGNPSTGANPTFSSLPQGLFAFCHVYDNTVHLNAGQRPFAYTAPSGFKALNTSSLPQPLVTKPSTVFDVSLYTGNGGVQTVSGLGFSPDLLWFKARSIGYGHIVYDTVRGTGAASLSTNGTQAEGAFSTNANLTAFNSDGFTFGATSSTNGVNTNNETFVGWAWDAGSTTVTNTQGSITSSVRANATAGFSIVTYTGNGIDGATVGHGLGVAPELIILKARGNAYNWGVWHKSIGKYDANHSYALALNLTRAADGTAQYAVFYPGLNSSTVFGLGNEATSNQSSATYVAYCFAPVVGYSSALSWTGNGSTDGPMIYTGHRSRWLIVKRTDSAGSWYVFDSARETFNVLDNFLMPNRSDAETTYTFGDFLANGIKIRDNSADWNANGGTYIGFSFAESPFQYARAR